MVDIAALRRILQENRTVAVVGLSPDRHRPSHLVAKYLLDHGYHVIPVNPGQEMILGQPCYPSLLEIPEPVDVVNLFRKPQHVPLLIDQAIRIGAKVIWMQLGIVHEQAAAKARKAGLEVVMDRCMKIEHARLFGL
jgi:predicted CoA-binding protein